MTPKNPPDRTENSVFQSDSLVLQGENNATRKIDCLHEVFKRDSINCLVELKYIHKSRNPMKIVEHGEQC